jgi:hypothetical protein
MTDFVWLVNYKPLNPHWQTFARLVDKQQQIDLEKEHKTPKKTLGNSFIFQVQFLFFIYFYCVVKIGHRMSLNYSHIPEAIYTQHNQ